MASMTPRFRQEAEVHLGRSLSLRDTNPETRKFLRTASGPPLAGVEPQLCPGFASFWPSQTESKICLKICRNGSQKASERRALVSSWKKSDGFPAPKRRLRKKLQLFEMPWRLTQTWNQVTDNSKMQHTAYTAD